MNDLNNINVIGRMTRDGDIKYTNSGIAIMNISIAVNESVKDNGNWTERANFFDVTVFGKSAEVLKDYAGKGKQIAISGHLQQQRWEQDGQARSKVVIIAEYVQLLGSKNDGQGQNNGYSQGGYQQPQQNAYQQKPQQKQPYQQAPQTQGYGQRTYQTPQQPELYQDNGFPEDIPF